MSNSVGKLVVAALQHPAESANKILIVNSFTATPNEILAEFEKQTGSKWDVSYVSLDKLKEVEKQWWETEKPYATGATLRCVPFLFLLNFSGEQDGCRDGLTNCNTFPRQNSAHCVCSHRS